LPRQAVCRRSLNEGKAKGKHDEHTPTRRSYTSPPRGEAA
jgi:hypothetical protein